MKVFKEVTGSGEDVVLIHGWACDYRYMHTIAKMLESKYQVTNVNLAGVGDSQWSDNINSIHDFADALMDTLPEKAILIGWSFGGLVAQSIAARYPERVERLILVGSAPRFIEDDNWPGVPKPGFKAAFVANTNEDFIAFMTEYYNNEFGGKTPDNYHAIMKVLTDYVPFTFEVLHKGIDICDNADLRQEYQQISCPIDFILGDTDPSVIVDFDKVKALNPKANMHYIKGAQHMMMWTHPVEFEKILKAILQASK